MHTMLQFWLAQHSQTLFLLFCTDSGNRNMNQQGLGLLSCQAIGKHGTQSGFVTVLQFLGAWSSGSTPLTSCLLNKPC